MGHHRRLGYTRVGHDQRPARIRLQVLTENWMVVRDVCAKKQNYVRFGQVLVRPWRSVATKRALISGHSARHAQSCVAVEILRSQT